MFVNSLYKSKFHNCFLQQFHQVTVPSFMNELNQIIDKCSFSNFSNKLLNGPRDSSWRGPQGQVESSPAQLGVADAFPAPPGGHQVLPQPNREVGVSAELFCDCGILGGGVSACQLRRKRAASFVLVVLDGFPKEGKLALGNARHINSSSQSCIPGRRSQSMVLP